MSLLRAASIAVSLVVLPFLLSAQVRPQFEVAAIKPAGDLTGDIVLGLNAGSSQVHLSWSSLMDMINMAYRVKRYQISGPPWLATDHFNIDAKIPEGLSNREVPEMLQSMLVDRFGMKSHWEKKEFPVYTLELLKPGPNLKEVAAPEFQASFPIGNINGGTSVIDFGGGGRFSFGDNVLEARKLNLNQFTEWLSNFLDKPVINNTALNGYYDFELKLSAHDFQTMWLWAAMAGGANIPPGLLGGTDASSLDTLPNAMKQLGFKLDRGKGLIDVLVIDTIERKPTEN